jgi:hypothetical protein
VHEHNFLKIKYSYAALIIRISIAKTKIEAEAINEFYRIIKMVVGRNV